ncbi:hypothetical protein [Acinetobacter nosocomialis]|uniref:hypothetical protein n=1 Tax=Acinetobacter nosocomialis TaxID=106654 RepID=UPI0029D591DC|nr:hypothetical protein [Acinetobacter nosocomialis]MDX7882056.1 hypothetical protein [Acinetobacter nosocomialis]
MKNDLVLSYTLSNGETHFYGYFLHRNDGSLTSGFNQTPEEVIEGLKQRYGERLVSTSLDDEIEYFKKELEFLIPKQIDEEEYKSKFNILPPAKMYKSESVEAFMCTEPLAINLYTHFVNFPKHKKAFQIVAFGNTPITDVIKQAEHF